MVVWSLFCLDSPVVGSNLSKDASFVRNSMIIFDCGPASTRSNVSSLFLRRCSLITDTHTGLRRQQWPRKQQSIQLYHRAPVLSRSVYYSVRTLLLLGRHPIEGYGVCPKIEPPRACHASVALVGDHRRPHTPWAHLSPRQRPFL